jgi:hypothetical protein
MWCVLLRLLSQATPPSGYAVNKKRRGLSTKTERESLRPVQKIEDVCSCSRSKCIANYPIRNRCKQSKTTSPLAITFTFTFPPPRIFFPTDKRYSNPLKETPCLSQASTSPNPPWRRSSPLPRQPKSVWPEDQNGGLKSPMGRQ